MRRGSALLLLGALACRSDRAGARATSPSPPPSSEEAVREALVRRAIDEAARFLREGDLEAARDRVERLQGGEAPAELAPTIRGLAALLEGEEWRARLESGARLEPASEVVEAGEPMRLALRVRNDGPVPVSFPGGEGGRGGAGIFDITFVERRVDGTDFRERESRPFTIGPLEVAAGGEASVLQEIPTPPGAAYALREVEVAAELRPASFEAGGTGLPLHRVRFRPCRIRVCPPGYRGVAERPLESLRLALSSPSPRFDRHVLLAAAFVSDAEREEAVAACAVALSGADPRRQRGAAAALRILLRRDDLPPDPDLWRARLKPVASAPAPR